MSTAKLKEVAYKPSPSEPFMNERQKEYFRSKILAWKDELLAGSMETLENLKEESYVHEADLNDRASNEVDRSFELRTRDRERKLLGKLDSALQRIENGTYGYCEETGNPISLARLEVRPIATLSIEAQERHEQKERTHRETE
ncbi:MAG: RNA polymerase-binding protein DksA [Alphaproteobacteria bacterium]